MIIKRLLAQKIVTLAHQFPVVAVLGPRQSGKTTLVKETFQGYEYANLEDLSLRALVKADPKAFLNQYADAKGIIIDEIQHVPDLFSYIQVHVDSKKKKGHYILTGSQNFALNQSLSQTLAGRVAILTLLPLCVQELKEANRLPSSIDQLLFTGLYPALYSDSLDPLDWYRSYIATYVERDVRQIRNISDLTAFQHFMKLCAGRVGNVLKLTSLSNETGMSVTTIKQWLTMLEASYIIFLLQPFYRTHGKRLLKAPKLYFYDTGLACRLLDIESPDQLFSHYNRGNLFESFIISDLFKQRQNKGMNPNVYFWRDKSDYEIDCVVEKAQNLIPIEIKISQTFNMRFLEYMGKWNTLTKTNPAKNILIYGGDYSQMTKLGHLLSWHDIENLE